MITRLSKLFVRTLRDDPADAEVASHRWLVRAGYIRRSAPGIYSWLPLGLKVLAKVERIVREEMDAIGAQEVRFPALLPREPYEATDRWTQYGPNLFRLKDRKGGDYLLGPTHEEMFTLLVKDLYSSYKDLPLSLYQVQTKYRDEARPRAGILRGREFVMKDSYSFDVDDAGLEASYQAHREAYIAIMNRLGLEFVIVRATSGAMGGSASEEFLAIAESGEDTFVRSPGGYAANVEAVVRPLAEVVDASDAPAAHVEDTPDTPTIDTLVALSNERFPRADRPWRASDTLKNVLFMLRDPDGTRTPLAIGLPGDREVDLKRLEAAVDPAEVEPFGDADFEAYPDLVKGYIGPGALGVGEFEGDEPPAGKVMYLTDPAVVAGTRWITGANQPGRHVYDLSASATSAPTACWTWPRSARAIRHPTAPGRSAWPGASRWATSSSWVASTPRRSASRCSTRTASWSPSPWAPTGSGCRARSPRSPRPMPTSAGCAGRGRWRRSTSRSSRPARTRRWPSTPNDWRWRCRPPASRCCWTTGRRVPG